uniref:Tryptophan 2,3-dioxygenase n=2 Tax=Rhodosorus marinus TaxID=101924 RepID=A0A7S2ZW65_9RHOD|mmetsp:Transcript_33855/g.132964  ORF Transcript_33855/g.132964 Transcript_33855/m.132964 type:complete len:330 (+) Transcript_33855:236-1225(+)
MGCPYGYGSLPKAELSVESRIMSPSEKAENAGSMKRKHEEVVLGELSSRSIAEVRRSRKDPLYYADYLKLDKILNAQEPLSWKAKDLCHDELLFITIHQTYELWFKQLIFEIDSVRDIFECLRLGEKQISTALHRLNRVKEIQKILVEQIRVLETMTAQEFLNFRDYLFPASGFQSLQFRLLETKLGLKLEKRVNQDFINKLKEEDKKKVEKALSEPSLFDYVERWLRNMPFIEFRGYRFASHYKEAVEKMHNLDSCALNRMLEGEEREAAMKDLASTMEIYESVWDKDVHNKQKELGARRLGFRATNACLMMMLYEDQPMYVLSHVHT